MGGDIGVDITDEIEADIDHNAGYNHEAAGGIQISIAEPEDSSAGIDERIDTVREEAAEQHDAVTEFTRGISSLSASVKKSPLLRRRCRRPDRKQRTSPSKARPRRARSVGRCRRFRGPPTR